jgi:hypothetical protein
MPPPQDLLNYFNMGGQMNSRANKKRAQYRRDPGGILEPSNFTRTGGCDKIFKHLDVWHYCAQGRKF